MIRADLMPKRKEVARIFGRTIERDSLAQVLIGLAVVAITAAIGMGVEEVRIHRLTDLLIARETSLAVRAGQRAAAKKLALDVARYQQFAREAASFHRSGASAALAVAQIGNAVPRAVWLESLEPDSGGYTLNGVSVSVDVLARTMVALDHALPRSRAVLQSIENRNAQRDGVHFHAHLVVTGGDHSLTGTP